MIFATADEPGMTAAMNLWRSWSLGRKIVTVIVTYFALAVPIAIVHPDPQPNPPAKWCQQRVQVPNEDGVGYTSISEKVLCP